MSDKNESTTVKKPSDKKKNAKVFLNAGSILLGGIILSCAIYFSANGVSLPEKETATETDCSGDNRLEDGCYDKYAQDLGLDLNQFQECVEEEKYFDIIDKEIAAGEKYGVTGTPSFYVGTGRGDRFQAFYVGGVRLQELELLTEKMELDGIEAASEYWQLYLSNSIQEYESSILEYYASEQGGSLTGDELDNAVKDYIAGELERIKTDSVVQNMEVGNGKILGDGEIVLLEFSDYECPYCLGFAQEALEEIKKAFVDTGKARYIYRDFPLENIHPKARSAANAARCAGEQDKYFEYHDKLFKIN